MALPTNKKDESLHNIGPGLAAENATGWPAWNASVEIFHAYRGLRGQCSHWGEIGAGWAGLSPAFCISSIVAHNDNPITLQ